MEHETFEDVATGLPRYIEACNRRLGSALGRLSLIDFENRNARAPARTAA